ncbi:hypothetical protein H4582DRAFT_245059 [Lactarius indigo]|nr:hypothetical protein H4582DRAFT_245059 [Lactarius indigo]
MPHNWRSAYSFLDEKVPIAYVSEQPQYRFPYTAETYNNPQKVWLFAEKQYFRMSWGRRGLVCVKIPIEITSETHSLARGEARGDCVGIVVVRPNQSICCRARETVR